MVLQYKCPDCGANMSYDADSGLLKCDSCGRKIKIEDMASVNGSADSYQEADNSTDNVEEVNGDYEDFKEESTYGTYGENEAIQYHCENCGAELITDAYTTATTCSYCGSPMIIGERLTGSMAPATVLPFTVSKEEAHAAFQKWCHHGLVTPSDFSKADRVKGISGMYVPFWLYDINGRGEAMGTATKVRHFSDCDYNYTETRYYHIYRKVDLNFNRIPADASKKMEDGLMDLMEPFPYENLKPFSAPYLSGYAAEKYNYTDKEMFPRVKEKSFHYIDSYIRSTIQGYSSFTIKEHHYDAKQRNAEYTMLPVWMLSYNYNGKDYMFAMNGQTGKVVGKPPICKKKVAGWFALISLGSFVLINLIVLLIGGGF